MNAIYKSEEDFQIYEIWQEYYNHNHLAGSNRIIAYKDEDWVFVEGIDTLRQMFGALRYTPSAKKIAKTLGVFYGNENVLYQQQIKQYGQNTRVTLMVKKGFNNDR